MDSEADGPTPVPPASEDDETVHIVLDGCNIAFEHGIAAGGALSGERRRFSAQGIRLALDYFRKKWGARAVAFLPRRHLEKFDTPGDALLLADMASRGEVARVPSGADDDRAMLRFAHALDAVIVSNDMYRDHVEDLASDPEVGPGFPSWLEGRRLQFMFPTPRSFFHVPPQTFDSARLARLAAAAAGPGPSRAPL